MVILQFVIIKESLPRGIMFNFFAVHVMLDLHSATDMMLQTVNDLQKLFPTSSHLTAAKALTLYHMRSESSGSLHCQVLIV